MIKRQQEIAYYMVAYAILVFVTYCVGDLTVLDAFGLYAFILLWELFIVDPVVAFIRRVKGS